jgi:hypothetical protein
MPPIRPAMFLCHRRRLGTSRWRSAIVGTVFLILAAQYESWSLPFSVLLGMPIAVMGAFLALTLRRRREGLGQQTLNLHRIRFDYRIGHNISYP